MKGQLVSNQDTLFWGGIHLPQSIGDQHFCIVGAPGSGKTKSLLLLMKSILSKVRTGTNRRALIYDAKRDIYSTLIGMDVPSDRIILLNPFDLRSCAWNMAKDIDTPAAAMEIGTILVPERSEFQPFFPEAARSLIGGVMEAFIQLAPGKWTLRDVVLGLSTAHRTAAILKNNLQTQFLVTNYLTGTDSQKSITATIANIMRRLTFVAAAWDKSSRSISLQDWLRSESILLLGSSPTLHSTVQQLNAAILHRLTQLIMDGEEARFLSPNPQTWIIVDELRRAGRFDDLPGFMVAGRSKGACVVIGFQDLPGLIEVYNENLAHEIIGACRNKAFLKITEDKTAEFASKHFGNQELEVTQYTRGWNTNHSGPEAGQSESLSETKSRVVQETITASQFRDIPEANPRNGIGGFYDTACIGSPYFATLPGDFVEREVPRPAKGIKDVIPRPPEHQILRDWTTTDLERLGLAKYPELLQQDAIPEPKKPKPVDFLTLFPKGTK